jgi:hypothetical protein
LAVITFVASHELVVREREVHVIELRAPERRWRCSSRCQTAGAASVSYAGSLEDPAAVVQRVREHVDLGIRPIHQLAIHPDLLDLGDGTGSSSS